MLRFGAVLTFLLDRMVESMATTAPLCRHSALTYHTMLRRPRQVVLLSALAAPAVLSGKLKLSRPVTIVLLAGAGSVISVILAMTRSLPGVVGTLSWMLFLRVSVLIGWLARAQWRVEVGVAARGRRTARRGAACRLRFPRRPAKVAHRRVIPPQDLACRELVDVVTDCVRQIHTTIQALGDLDERTALAPRP